MLSLYQGLKWLLWNAGLLLSGVLYYMFMYNCFKS